MQKLSNESLYATYGKLANYSFLVACSSLSYVSLWSGATGETGVGAELVHHSFERFTQTATGMLFRLILFL